MQLKFLTLASIACLVASASAALDSGLDSTTVNSYGKAALRGAQLFRRQNTPPPDCSGIDPDLIKEFKDDPEGAKNLAKDMKELKKNGKKFSDPDVQKDVKEKLDKIKQQAKTEKPATPPAAPA